MKKANRISAGHRSMPARTRKKIKIQQKNDREYYINDVHVFKDMEGNWISTETLPIEAIQIFQQHVRSAEDSKEYHNHPVS